jgi:hypothetical protein
MDFGGLGLKGKETRQLGLTIPRAIWTEPWPFQNGLSALLRANRRFSAHFLRIGGYASYGNSGAIGSGMLMPDHSYA